MLIKRRIFISQYWGGIICTFRESEQGKCIGQEVFVFYHIKGCLVYSLYKYPFPYFSSSTLCCSCSSGERFRQDAGAGIEPGNLSCTMQADANHLATLHPKYPCFRVSHLFSYCSLTYSSSNPKEKCIPRYPKFDKKCITWLKFTSTMKILFIVSI